MKRILSCLLIGIFLCTVTSFAQPDSENNGNILARGLGFAFQGKDFKTIKLILINENSDKSAISPAGVPDKNPGQEPQAQLKGKLIIGGYPYNLKVTLFETVNIEADLFSEEFTTPAGSDSNEKKLPIPLGHVSLTLSEPEPGNPVILGSMRLKDEKVTAITGEFELYLNDITRKPNIP